MIDMYVIECDTDDSKDYANNDGIVLNTDRASNIVERAKQLKQQSNRKSDE